MHSANYSKAIHIYKTYTYKKYEKNSVITLMLIWRDILIIVSTLLTFFAIRHS